MKKVVDSGPVDCQHPSSTSLHPKHAAWTMTCRGAVTKRSITQRKHHFNVNNVAGHNGQDVIFGKKVTKCNSHKT
jgi:hypothetical protein